MKKNIDTNSENDLISPNHLRCAANTCASFIVAHKLFRWFGWRFFFFLDSLLFVVVHAYKHKHEYTITFCVPNVMFIHRYRCFTRNGKHRGSKTRIKERARKSYTRTLERNVLTKCAAASKPRRTQSRHNVYPRGSRKKKRNKVSQAKKEGTLIRKEKWYVRVCLRLFLSWYFMATTISMPMLSALENFFFSIAAPRKRKIHLIHIITQLTTIECGIFIWCSLHWVSFCSHRKTNDS